MKHARPKFKLFRTKKGDERKFPNVHKSEPESILKIAPPYCSSNSKYTSTINDKQNVSTTKAKVLETMVDPFLRSKQKMKKDQSTIQHTNNRQPPSSRWYFYLGFFVLGIIMLVRNFVFFQNSAASITMAKIHSSMDWNALLPLGNIDNVNGTSAVKFNNNDNDQQLYTVNNNTTTKTKTKTTVAYAITVTNFAGLTTNPEPRKGMILDRAAVLHQSIKLAMNTSSRYDYDIHAFVHPEAVEVVPWLKRLGYRVHIKDTPFNITDIQNPDLIAAQNNGCCQERVSEHQRKKKKKKEEKRTEQKLLRIEFEILSYMCFVVIYICASLYGFCWQVFQNFNLLEYSFILSHSYCYYISTI